MTVESENPPAGIGRPPGAEAGVAPLTLLHGTLLVLLTFVAYLPAILYGGFIWDDTPHILKNQMLYQDDALYRIWCTLEFQQFYPMQHFSHWLEIKLFGVNAAEMHAVNVLLHALVGVLIWRVLLRLRFPLAWFAAAVFVLHPINVETAAWLTERRNLLSASFYLSALICWLRFDAGEGGRWYAASFVLFVAALYSKTVSCTLPVIILLLKWSDGADFTAWRRCGVRMLPYFVAGIPLGLLTASMERYLIGANGYEWNFSLVERILICGRALWFYALKIVWPLEVNFIYPRWKIDPADPLQWAWVVAAVLLIAALVPIARKFGRRAAVPLLFFGITLFPASGFSNIYPQRFSLVADHFQYLAGLGMIVFVIGALHALAVKFEAARPALAWRAAGGVLLLALGTASARHALVYESDEVMWRDVLSKNNDAWMAHTNLGVLLFNRGDHEGALQHYKEAKRCGPNDTETLYKLGDALAKLNRTDEARLVFNEALASSPAFEMVKERGRADQPLLARAVRSLAGTPPDFLPIYHRMRVTFTMEILLALAHLDIRTDPTLAMKHIDRAAELAPKSPRPCIVRGEIYEQVGRTDEALLEYTRAGELSVVSGDGFCHKGDLLLKLGRRPEAVTAYREAIKREPTHSGALTRLATIAVEDGKVDEALKLYGLLVSLNPADGAAQMRLGVLNARAGRFKEALEHLQLARNATPQQADVYVNLAQVHAASGNAPAAAAVLREGLKTVGAETPSAPRLNDNLAWLLATSKEDSIRDGKEAVKLAKLVVEKDPQNAQAHDTLAAAHAEAGDFDAAVAFGVRALELAEKAGQAVLREKIAQRIKLYESRKPFRQ